MAIATYSDLKSALSTYTGRSDISDTLASDMVTLAESWLNRNMSVIRQNDYDTLSITAGATEVNLPSDYLNMVTLQHQTSPKTMNQVTRKQISDTVASSQAGRPVQFSIANGKIFIAPTSDGAYTLAIDYVAKIPALTVSNTTNWLLSLYPDIYLNATLYQLYLRFKDVRAADFLGLLRQSISEIQSSDTEMKVSSGVQMRARTAP